MGYAYNMSPKMDLFLRGKVLSLQFLLCPLLQKKANLSFWNL